MIISTYFSIGQEEQTQQVYGESQIKSWKVASWYRSFCQDCWENWYNSSVQSNSFGLGLFSSGLGQCIAEDVAPPWLGDAIGRFSCCIPSQPPAAWIAVHAEIFEAATWIYVACLTKTQTLSPEVVINLKILRENYCNRCAGLSALPAIKS